MKLFKFHMIVCFGFLCFLNALSQEKNFSCYIEKSHDENQYLFTGFLENKTSVIQSLTFKLAVIKNDINHGNSSRNEQSGSVVLQPLEKQKLSQTAINISSEDRVIILLLIYDVNNNLVATDRVVLNDTKSQEEILKEFSSVLDPSNQAEKKKSKAYDGINFSGIVIDESKTKAGRDFYQLFYSSYLSKQIMGDKVIKIIETLTLGNNTKIVVKVDSVVVFEFFVKSQYDYVKAMSDVAIQRVEYYFKRMERETQLIKRF